MYVGRSTLLRAGPYINFFCKMRHDESSQMFDRTTVHPDVPGYGCVAGASGCFRFSGDREPHAGGGHRRGTDLKHGSFSELLITRKSSFLAGKCCTVSTKFQYRSSCMFWGLLCSIGRAHNLTCMAPKASFRGAFPPIVVGIPSVVQNSRTLW